MNAIKHISVLLVLLLASKPAVGQIRDQQQLDSLTVCLQRTENDSSRVPLLLGILSIYQSYKTEEGFKYEQQVRRIAGSFGAKPEAAKLKSAIGRLHWHKGNFETALQYHNEALKIYEALGDKKGIALTTTYIGQDYADDGKYAEALQYFERAKQMYESLGNQRQIGSMYLFFAFVYSSQGNHAEAAKQNFNALSAFEKAGDEGGVAIAMSNIGDAYDKIGNYTEALKFYHQASIVLKRIDDNINRSNSFNSIGGIYRKLKKYPEALANLDSALSIGRAIGDHYCIANAYAGIGSIWKLQGKPALALPNYQQAVEHFQKVSNKMELASVYAEIGICQVQLNNLAEARPAFERAEAIAKNLDSKIPLADLYHGMEMLDSATGDWQGAYSNHKQYIALRDSIFNQESARKIMFSQLQYEFDKKELVARNEEDKRNSERRNMIAIALGIALLFFSVVFYQLKMRRDRDQAEAKRLRDLSEAKSQFLTTVSHELRTPLTSILGFSKIIKKRLQERVLPVADLSNTKNARAAEQTMDNLNIVISESERLTTLINEVLDLAKIESGKAVWHREQVDIGKIIQQASANTTTIFEQKNLRLKLDIAPNLPSMIGDSNRLLQVMINLLSNAVKFTSHGGVRVTARQQDENTILVGIADTGIGIAKAFQETIFEKFKQLSSDTLTDKPEGTGLGLPICREIIEHHGGRIWVESSIGSGSVFWFTLPVR